MELLKLDDLENDEIKLKVKEIYQGNEKIGLLPAYLFDIFNIEHKRVGYCDLRIGYNEEAYYGGHIGYLIYPPYGGNHYAAKACKLLFQLAKNFGMTYLYITCNPDNIPSIKTCEYLEGELLEITEVPKDSYINRELNEKEECIYQFYL